MAVVKTSPEFERLTAEEVTAALNDPDPLNKIALEVARLITDYMTNFKAHCDRVGYVPEKILRRKTDTAIEEIAMNLTTQAIQSATLPPFVNVLVKEPKGSC